MVHKTVNDITTVSMRPQKLTGEQFPCVTEGKLAGGLLSLDPLGWTAAASWPRPWILQLHFNGLQRYIEDTWEDWRRNWLLPPLSYGTCLTSSELPALGSQWKRICRDLLVQLSNLGVNEISIRDLHEARKLIFTFSQGEFEPMSPDLKV